MKRISGNTRNHKLKSYHNFFLKDKWSKVQIHFLATIFFPKGKWVGKVQIHFLTPYLPKIQTQAASQIKNCLKTTRPRPLGQSYHKFEWIGF